MVFKSLQQLAVKVSRDRTILWVSVSIYLTSEALLGNEPSTKRNLSPAETWAHLTLIKKE